MTKNERRRVLVEIGIHSRELYTVQGLARALNELGHPVDLNDLYVALKSSGWIKLRLIRDRLLATKRALPKRCPFDGIRHLIKWPLLVKRHEDLPDWERRSRW